jgi:hypothetical protein
MFSRPSARIGRAPSRIPSRLSPAGAKPPRWSSRILPKAIRVAPRGIFKDSGLQTINSRLYVLSERKQPHDRRLVANRGKHSICQFQLMLQALKLGYEVHLICPRSKGR